MAAPHDDDAQERGEYCLGRHRVPIDRVPVDRFCVPRRRARDVTTRPILAEPARPEGPTLEDLARLDAGKLATVLIARYRLERRLGKGGMASVYRGIHMTLDRPVAVKVLTRDLTAHPDSLARFMNEARLHAMVQHPNVVEVMDFGATPEGVAYLVMQLHEGENLRATLKREGTLAWPRVRTLMLQLCSALEAVHGRGIVHRDIKPSNCLHLSRDGQERLVLADFGVAYKIGDTLEKEVVGTPEYMSPEQAKGEQVDGRSDLYSLGILLGELLTGRVPFTDKPMPAILDAQIHEPAPRLAKLAKPGSIVTPELETIYRRALAKDPAERFASVGEFAAALLAIDAPPILAEDGASPLPFDDETVPGRPFVIDPAPSSRMLVIASGVALAFGLTMAWAGGLTHVHTCSATGRAGPVELSE